MIRRLLLAAALAASVVSAPQQPINAATHYDVAASTTLAMFDTEAAAQAHCPRDVVVWLNIPTGIWHEKGMRWYGNTKHGAYVCRKEAKAAGDRDTRNGQ
jgi:hypothetical protein